MRIVYGYDIKKEDMLAKSGLPTLEARRSRLFENFCKKSYANSRFKKAWFTEREFTGHDLRKQKILVEKPARTNRLFNSPLYAMRRKINDLNVY